MGSRSREIPGHKSLCRGGRTFPRCPVQACLRGSLREVRGRWMTSLSAAVGGKPGSFLKRAPAPRCVRAPCPRRGSSCTPRAEPEERLAAEGLSLQGLRGGRCAGRGQVWGSCRFHKGRNNRAGKLQEKPSWGLQAWPPRQENPRGREGAPHGKERNQPESPAKGVLRIFIRDETCSCLCTTHFPPKWRALSLTECLNSLGVPRGN